MREGLIHFIGFKGDEWWSALTVFGRPDFIHRLWDRRAQGMLAPGDVAIFANSVELKPPSEHDRDDSAVF